MKNIFIPLLFALMTASCQPKDLPTVFDLSKDHVLLKVSHMTTQQEMIDIKSKLNDISGINFIIHQCEFLEDGHLQVLRIGVETPNESRGSASADLLNLQYNYYGFEYNTDGKFSIGQM